MTWAQIATLIVSIAATVAAGTGVIVLSVNGIHSQVAALQAQAAADRAEAAADRRAWQASTDAFREKADADREAFRAQAETEGASAGGGVAVGEDGWPVVPGTEDAPAGSGPALDRALDVDAFLAQSRHSYLRGRTLTPWPDEEPPSAPAAAMSPDTIALIVAIIGTGAMLAGLIVPSLRELRRGVADLRERMARLEGLFEGFTRRETAPPPA